MTRRAPALRTAGFRRVFAVLSQPAAGRGVHEPDALNGNVVARDHVPHPHRSRSDRGARRGARSFVGVEVVTMVVGKADVYPETVWKAFALGASIACLAVTIGDLLRPIGSRRRPFSARRSRSSAWARPARCSPSTCRLRATLPARVAGGARGRSNTRKCSSSSASSSPLRRGRPSCARQPARAARRHSAGHRIAHARHRGRMGRGDRADDRSVARGQHRRCAARRTRRRAANC